MKSFWEEKHKVYQEILPVFQKAAYNPRLTKEDELNRALGLMWLYANRKVATKLDKVHAITIKPERGNITKALKEAIAEMRNDIQAWPFIHPFGTLKPQDIKHIYTRIFGGKETPKEDGDTTPTPQTENRDLKD
jgi:hypothetical protein